MPNEPLTGARYPAASAAPNVPQDIQNAVMDLADNTIPTFVTSTARDAAYQAWVAAGGAMRDGLRCYVSTDAQFQNYEDGSWRMEKYAGAISLPGTPIINTSTSGGIPNNTVTTVTGYAADRSHPAMTYNGNGIWTVNQRGVWVINARFVSDYTTGGTSSVNLTISDAPYVPDSTVWRNTGAPLAGLLRQNLAFVTYMDAGATFQSRIFQTNSNSASVSYTVNMSFQLIG